ncbi:hypothetical protein M405DRAFT_868952 [Rhizopogon salebrosus TDB-379]|nr:hypothetical protein M405DRAFT_868952 [Rhizopogon salebrosus TDB-379]
MPTSTFVDGAFLDSLRMGQATFRESELHVYVDRVSEAVRKDSPNRHVDETHLRKLRLYALAVRGPSSARIQTYGHVAELPCVTVLNQKPIAHTGLSSHFCPGWTELVE